MASSTPSVPPIHDPSHPSAAHNSIAQPHNSVLQPQPHYADLDDEQESDAVPTTQPAPPSHPSPEIRLALLGPYMLMVVCTFADLFLSMLAKGLDNVPSTRNINWGKMAIQAVFYLSCVPLAVYSTIKGPRHWLPYLVVILLIGVAVGFTAESQFVIISSAIAIVYGFKHADSSTLSFLPFLQPVLRLLFNIPGRTGAAAPHNQDLEMGMAARPPLQHGQYGNTSIATAPTDPTAAASTGNATASHAPSHESNSNSSGVTTSQQSS